MTQEHSIEIQATEADLIENWIEQEKQGVRFPVPFDSAWKMAGYSRKDSAKRKLTKQGYFVEREDFHIKVDRTPHKDSEAYSTVERIFLSNDAFREFCMLSKSATGKATRKYFIAAEKELSIIKKSHPEIAREAEEKRLSQQERILDKQERILDKANTLAVLHGQEFALIAMGHHDKIAKIEKTTTEVLEPETGNSVKIMSASQVKEYIRNKTGIQIKSLSELTRKIQEKGRDDLLVPVTRHNTNLYPIPEKIDEAIALVFGDKESRQMLLGE